MARGGKRPGAGRKLGSVSKLSRHAAEAEFNKGMSPLEFFPSVMRDPEQPLGMRLDAAKAAAPYMHPKLSAVEISDKNENLVNEPPLSTLECARRLAFLLASAQESFGASPQGSSLSEHWLGRWSRSPPTASHERLWRSIKYEEVHLKAHADGCEARSGISSWMNFYNFRRPHQGDEQPDADGGVARRHGQNRGDGEGCG